MPDRLHTDGLAIRAFPTAAKWQAWLEKNHATARGLWIQLARKTSGEKSVSRPDALDHALCYGWIDGQAAPLDDRHWLQRFTPRRPRSKWSAVNCRRVAELIAAGLMQPAGLRQIEAAKADGRWDSAYESQSCITVPPDLQSALAADSAAAAFFATLTGSNRYAILYRLHDAKRPETRARRLEKFLTMLREKKTIH